jgi:hypothetical protein
MGVETAFAIGAEQVGDAHGSLAQHQLQVAMLALRTNFTHIAECHQVQGRARAVEVVDDCIWVEFAKDQVLVGTLLAAARRFRFPGVIRHHFRDTHSHWTDSIVDLYDTPRGSGPRSRKFMIAKSGQGASSAVVFFQLSFRSCTELSPKKKMPAN